LLQPLHDSPVAKTRVILGALVQNSYSSEIAVTPFLWFAGDAHGGMIYSYRKATIGSTRMARRAGR